MRVYSLTLRVDNLPEIGKRQYENKEGVARISTQVLPLEPHKKEKVGANIFPPHEMQGVI
ncbi:hypothetical protein [Bradyrhizobium sp.]|uniref:hypothetical protein n=1 Tax=Bradyrhizobium sp. TaxID=376 RepID=UPI003C777AA5